jgi:threonine dehydratase
VENSEAVRLNTRLDLGRIRAARETISPVFRDTPQFTCPPLGQLLGCDLVIKLETANPIRCFKGRGIEVVLSRLVLSGGKVMGFFARVRRRLLFQSVLLGYLPS